MKTRIVLLGLTVVLAAGCEKERPPEPVEKDARQMGREVGQAARKVGHAALEAARGVEEGLKTPPTEEKVKAQDERH